MRCSETSIRSPWSGRTNGHEYRATLGMNAGTGVRESSRVSADFSPLAWTGRVPCRETLSSSYVVSEIAPLVPTVITASGQRWLLNDTAVAVHYAPCQHILTHVTGSTVWLSTRHSLPGRT
jgi:hypothetical protein